MSRAAVIVVSLALAAVAYADEPPIRDPMRPFGGAVASGVSGAASRPRFALTGVLVAPSRRVALLNGKPYSAGAVVDGAEIVAIETGAVRMREHGVEFVISIAAPETAGKPIVSGETVP